MLKGFHHAGLICSDHDATIDFYINKLRLHLHKETYIEEQSKWKLEIWLNNTYLLEIFVMADVRTIEQNAAYHIGLNHLSFLVEDVPAAVAWLREMGIRTTKAMLSRDTGKSYAFFYDPDGQKLEVNER